jgi:hypothetical protein
MRLHVVSRMFAERGWIHPVRELALVLNNTVTFGPAEVPFTLGNHVIAGSGDLFAGVAHLAPGVIRRNVDRLGRITHAARATVCAFATHNRSRHRYRRLSEPTSSGGDLCWTGHAERSVRSGTGPGSSRR